MLINILTLFSFLVIISLLKLYLFLKLILIFFGIDEFYPQSFLIAGKQKILKEVIIISKFTFIGNSFEGSFSHIYQKLTCKHTLYKKKIIIGIFYIVILKELNHNLHCFTNYLISILRQVIIMGSVLFLDDHHLSKLE